MDTRTLPRHALTGVTALGWRKPRTGETPGRLYPIWPILGGAPDDDDGGSEDDADDDEDGEGDDGKDGKGKAGKSSDKDDETDWKAEAEKHKALSRKHEGRAKENANAAKELARIKREGMPEQERKVAEAVAKAVAEVKASSGAKLARQAFLAAAKGVIDNAGEVAEDVNLARYVDDEGEVDESGLADLVKRLAPKGSDTDDDEDDGDDDGRDTRTGRRRRGLGQGARNGSGRSKSKRGHVDADELFEDLLGRKPQTAQS